MTIIILLIVPSCIRLYMMILGMLLLETQNKLKTYFFSVFYMR